MADSRARHLFSLTLLAVIVLVGCGKGQHAGAPLAAPPVAGGAPKVAKKRVSARPANTQGSVFIVEYHKVQKEEKRWDRSYDRFKNDLAKLYRAGFRPVLMSEYLSGKMDLAPGASPIVFTFDDSTPSQFSYLPDGTIDPKCAVGMWQAFATRHPDFPVRATFFILPNTGPWGPRRDADKKFAQLKAWGCEVGSHTMTHPHMNELTSAQVKKELAGAIDFIKAKGFDPQVLALPYGQFPLDRSLLAGFDLNGKHYGHKAVLLVGAGPAPSPESKKFDPLRLPRIQGIDEPFGITYWLDRLANGKVHPYVAP